MALSLMVSVGGIAVLLLYGVATGSIYVLLGLTDFTLMASVWRGARGVRGAAYCHPELQVTSQLQNALRERGIDFTLGHRRQWPLGTYRSIGIPSLGLRVGILQGLHRRSLVLFKGVGPANEESAQLLLMALDKGLFRSGEGPLQGSWL